MDMKEAETILPPKLIDDLKKDFKEFKLTATQKEKVIKKTVELYRQSCYDPGEGPAGVHASKTC